MKPRMPGYEAPLPPLLTDDLLAEVTQDGVLLTTAVPTADSVDHIELPLSHYAACRLRFWLNQVLA